MATSSPPSRVSGYWDEESPYVEATGESYMLDKSSGTENELSYSDLTLDEVDVHRYSSHGVSNPWKRWLLRLWRRRETCPNHGKDNGIIHVLHVLIGRARLFWDLSYNDFLPNWGKPGFFGEGLSGYPTDVTRDVLPIPCHSHNDYWRRVPLFEAVHWGCTGVEADVWLFDEELYVGHNTAALTRNRTLRSLYINPLVDLLDKQNPQTAFSNTSRHGVFDEDPEQTLVLLIDFKTDGHELWPYVEEQLEPLRSKGYLTYFDGSTVTPGPITVVGTGNAPFDLVIANSTYRDVFFDAPLDQLQKGSQNPIVEDGEGKNNRASDADGIASPPRSESEHIDTLPSKSPQVFDTTSSYYASVSFSSTVGRVWGGHLSPRQMEIIRGQIKDAKKRGLKARYWETPSWPIGLRNHVWYVLVKEGVGMLNVDDLEAAAKEDWQRRRHTWW
ncbi:Altered inheritance of mitochondria protein 6 [Elasticomyces elasticus]|nr:Altered inheritance of mitochondria protein 6 [Elasticomyces elasticus]